MPEWLSFIDVAFVIAVVLFAWGGFQRGFAAQVAHILAFILMGVMLFFAYPHIHAFLRSRIRIDDTYIMWGVLAVLVVLSIVAFIFISKLLVTMLKAHVSESTDHSFGLLLGTVRGFLAALLFMILLAMLGPASVEERFRQRSFVGRFVAVKLVPIIHPHLNPGVIRMGIEKGRQMLDEEKQQVERTRYGED